MIVRTDKVIKVIPIWNSLSNHVVSTETVNTFKNRLDKFWLDKRSKYCTILKQISMASGTAV